MLFKFFVKNVFSRNHMIKLLIRVTGEIDHSVYNIMTYNEQVLRSTATVLIRKYIVHLYYSCMHNTYRTMCTDNERSTSGCEVSLLLVFLTPDLLFLSEVKLSS